jgi:hypothetical protein
MEYRQIKAEDIDRNEQGGFATPRTVAKDLGIYAQLIYSWGNRGHVRLYRVGARIYVDPKEVTAYHANNKRNAKASPFAVVGGIDMGDFICYDTKRGWARIALIVGVTDLLVDMVDALGNTLSFRTIKMEQMLSTGELTVVQPEKVMELVAEHYQQKGLPLDELLATARNAWKARGLLAQEGRVSRPGPVAVG